MTHSQKLKLIAEQLEAITNDISEMLAQKKA